MNTQLSMDEPIQELADEGEDDRISSLNDDILLKILCHLPQTKDAVATSALSNRWFDLWTKLPVLDFTYCEDNNDDDEADDSFLVFVDKVLSSNICQCIPVFRLCYENCRREHIFRINDLVQTAMTRRVKEFDLQLAFRDCNDSHNVAQEIGLWLSRCEFVQVLKIDVDVGVKVPDVNCFCNLKVFHLYSHKADDELLTSSLFTCLPKLEELLLTLHLLGNVGRRCSQLNIVTPLLKYLSVTLLTEGEILNVKVLIDAPMLEHLNIEDDFVYSYTLRNIPSTVQAYLNVGNDLYHFYGVLNDIDCGVNFIRKFYSFTYLTLSDRTMQAVSAGSIGTLPMFYGLKQLDVCVSPSLWKFILHFIKRAPNLEILVLDMEVADEEEEEENYNVNLLETYSMSHLKEVKIKGLAKEIDQGVQLLSYIMNNAKELNKFSVNSVEFSRD